MKPTVSGNAIFKTKSSLVPVTIEFTFYKINKKPPGQKSVVYCFITGCNYQTLK